MWWSEINVGENVHPVGTLTRDRFPYTRSYCTQGRSVLGIFGGSVGSPREKGYVTDLPLLSRGSTFLCPYTLMTCLPTGDLWT